MVDMNDKNVKPSVLFGKELYSFMNDSVFDATVHIFRDASGIHDIESVSILTDEDGHLRRRPLRCARRHRGVAA